MSESKIRKKIAETAEKTETVDRSGYLSHLSNRPFLIVTTTRRPAKGAITSKKGWATNPSAWEIFERPRIEDRVNKKALTEATVIIDIMQGKCVKNRFDKKSDSEVTEHYLGKYMEECKKGLDVWLTRRAKAYLGKPPAAPAKTEASATPPEPEAAQ